MSALDNLLEVFSGSQTRQKDEYFSELDRVNNNQIAIQAALADRKFQLEQQAAQREYDKPVNQVARFREAELNPYFQSISAGEYGTAVNSSLANVERTNRQNPGVMSRFSGLTEDLAGLISIVQGSVTAMSQIEDYAVQREIMKDKGFTSKFLTDSLRFERNLKRSNSILNAILQTAGIILPYFFGQKGYK